MNESTLLFPISGFIPKQRKTAPFGAVQIVDFAYVMARPEGFEPPTFWFVVRRFISHKQLIGLAFRFFRLGIKPEILRGKPLIFVCARFFIPKI